MKVYSKRFCVDCDSEKGMYVIRHKNYAMYHCRECKQEVARVGDTPGATRLKLIAGGFQAQRDEDGFEDGLRFTERAQANPDVLSDEHVIWPVRDEEAEATREDALRTLKVALAGLTARQRQVLEAVRVYKTQTRAALALRISQPVIKKTLLAIQKKLVGKGIKLSTRGKE